MTYLVGHKTKEINFKLMNNIYTTNELLRIKFGIDCNNCTFVDLK